jgi:PAS domain S-box-containing protein
MQPLPIPAQTLIDALALPLVVLESSGQIAWANEPAAALGAQPGLAQAALWQGPGLPWPPVARDATLLQTGGGRWFEATLAPLPEGRWLLTLQHAGARRAAEQAVERLQSLLDLARDFGRLGVWERNARTREGRWDAQTRRIWGLAPEAPTPAFEDAAGQIVPEDREAMKAYFETTLRKAGRYARRYRVRGADGVTRRVHSQWLVQDGSDGRPERVLGLMMDDTEPFALAQSAGEIGSQLALAVELANISIWRHDLQAGRMHYNTQGWRTLGLEPQPEGITLDEVRSLIHPDDLPRVVASAEAAMKSDQPVDVDARYRHADGSWRHQMLRRTVLRDDTGRVIAFLGVALDVTDKLEARRRADELSRRFETVTRTAGIGYWLYEPGQPNVTWSPELHRMFGLAKGEPVPRSDDWIERLVHPDDQARLRDTMRQWLRGEADNVKLAFRAIRPDGEVRHLFSHSQIEGDDPVKLLFGVVVDLTDQRRSELALRRVQERMAVSLRGAGLGTFEADLDGFSVTWDEQMWRLRGLAPQQREPTRDERSACLHPEDMPRVSRMLDDARANGGMLDYEFRVIWPDGSVHWLASRSVQITDPDSGHRIRLGVNWDVTEQRSAETVRQEREVALRESAAKSRFLARMSHELRTPLNAVLGFTQLMAADETGGDAASAMRQRRLEHIRSAGTHLLALINDALDLAGLQSGEVRVELQPVALAAVLEQTLPLLGTLPEASRVVLQRGPVEGHVRADATRLRQVLLNLLSNAFKYNRPGGTVQVEAVREGAMVLLRVADTGRGMSEQQLQQLFEPFNRLGAEREAVEGSGIGLAIVKALVARMGGTLAVRSTEGAGSVFELRLAAADPEPWQPAAAPATALQGAGTPAPRAAPRHVHQVLYIEDNPVNALIIGELMSRRSDLALHVAVDGASGLAQAQAIRPELILLDMQLPDMDGYEVMRRLRLHGSTAAIPCIALSANAMPEDIDRALAAGMSDYWTKPLDFRAFMASLDTLFGASEAR